ncbi:MAG: hypothetical protein P1U87_03505 [Verrucomicrobiales bacterium]|nr:hypothetical protein [Verrucomicrobiales bacterium]
MNKNAWDKMLLAAVSVVVLGLSGLFVMKALGFSERFTMEAAKPNNELPEIPIERVSNAKIVVDVNPEWKTPEKGSPPKVVPLFVSIPVVESGGQLIDMLDPNAPKLREPVTNSWLMENELDFLNAGVLSQDTDGDGFTNLTEWNEKTAPRDPDSHPSYAGKVVMHSRQQQEYKLKFSARPDAERFQIMRLPTNRWPQRDNFYLRIGEISEDKQFRLDAFEEKRARSSVGIEVDASVLTITYLPKDEEFQLIRNVDTVLPTYFTELEFELEPGKKFFVKEGDAFNIVKDPDTKYRVVKVNEDSTMISYQSADGPEKTLEIKKK